MLRVGILVPVWLLSSVAVAVDSFAPDRCELVPLPVHQVSMQIDGVEKTRWYFGSEYPRPFFYPFNGPSGTSLTRMGHPGAENHDHHRSVWFAHHDVEGVDFWSDNTDARVRQKHWYAYRDGNDEAIMAVVMGWYDGSGKELMEQDVVAALLPVDNGQHALEIQIDMRPPRNVESVQLGKTNFGLLAVRVAKTLSVHFGGGTLSNSEGLRGEADIFGKRARWMDYSGPVVVGRAVNREAVLEGITYFDHPANPRYPTYWHVREDGWMGASFNMQEGLAITTDEPLTLRYLLVAHHGAYDHAKAEVLHEGFARRPGFRVSKSARPHRQYEVARIEAD
jgi:hypothetical protein